jgi:RNA polymerase sigma-70 factor (ECF subfamily)
MCNIDEFENKELVNTALEKMPSDESVILTLYYIEDNPAKEIAKILGLTESNIKVKLHRARKRMREILTKLMSQ